MRNGLVISIRIRAAVPVNEGIIEPGSKKALQQSSAAARKVPLNREEIL